MAWLFLTVWLVVGYFFARWFVNHFLDDRKWADSDTEVGVLSLLGLTFAGPAMAFIMLLALVFGYLIDNYESHIKRFYGVK